MCNFTSYEWDLLVAGLASLHDMTDCALIHLVFNNGKIEHEKINHLIDKVKGFREIERAKLALIIREREQEQEWERRREEYYNHIEPRADGRVEN